ncbi:MAG TPA: hypothetical protein VFT76_00135 [Actinomycetota bacterium]|nr:hypothetical protein [Actinomycetota bacterium]
MRKLLLMAIAVAVVVALAAPVASADPIRKLSRRVARLENRVERVENLLGGFIGFFFECIVPGTTPTPIVGSDGVATTGYPLYVDSRCFSAASAGSLKAAFRDQTR